MRKKILITVMAAALAGSMAFNSFANSLKIPASEYGSMTVRSAVAPSTGHTIKYVAGKEMKFPGWIWRNGYCYYYQNTNANSILKNCTTPDGYTVDAEGRWTVNGVPQHDGLGSVVIGTDALYAGKNDEERAAVMKQLLEDTFAKYGYGENGIASMESYESGNYWEVTGIRAGVLHNSANGNYIDAYLGDWWTDHENMQLDNYCERFERIAKIVLGDHAGQEFYNDIKTAADPKGGNSAFVPVFDANGQYQMYTGEDGLTHVKGTWVGAEGDGINFALFPLAKWNGKKTDYGKTIAISGNISNGEFDVEVK